VFACLLSCAVAQAKDPLPATLKTYDSKYYVIQTDLAGDDVRETVLRMTKMAEIYYDRTRDFSGVINQRLPFLMFKNQADYARAGGMPGSAGVFNGEKLMAIAGEKVSAGTWHVVQHEGFHQFAHAVIRGDLPIWVNEGLAEYFGEGIFTGDGFVTGVIPAGRLRRVQETMKVSGRFMSIDRMMNLSHEEWNRQLTGENYDQAWSMVQFLAHGEDGKYQKAFTGYMRDIGKSKPAAKAWQDNFGDAAGFEERWREYWLGLPMNPTIELYERATVAMLTSALARSTAQKQTFDGFEEFAKAVKDNQLKQNDADWLPASVPAGAIGLATKVGKWSLATANKQPVVVAELEDGTRLTGNFSLKGNKVEKVWVETDDLKPALDKAKEMIAANAKDKDKAKRLLQDSMRKNPKSPLFEDARKFMAENK